MESFNKVINPISAKYLRKYYFHRVNKENIEGLSAFRLKRIFPKKDLDLKEDFYKKVIYQWYEENKNYSWSFFARLKKIIRKSKVVLDEVQKHELIELEEQIFSLSRHIKILLVNLPLYKDEVAGVKFERARLYKKGDLLEEIETGDLIFTNKRLFVGSKHFTYKEIDEFAYRNYGWEFVIYSQVYLLQIHDQITLNNTLKNFFAKKANDFAKRETKWY